MAVPSPPPRIPRSSSATRVIRRGALVLGWEPIVSQTRTCMGRVVTVTDVTNLVGGAPAPAVSGTWFEKLRPSDGTVLCRVARSQRADVDAAIASARAAQPDWAARTPVERGRLVREIALALQARREEAAQIVCDETGKSPELALGETVHDLSDAELRTLLSELGTLEAVTPTETEVVVPALGRGSQ